MKRPFFLAPLLIAAAVLSNVWRPPLGAGFSGRLSVSLAFGLVGQGSHTLEPIAKRGLLVRRPAIPARTASLIVGLRSSSGFALGHHARCLRLPSNPAPSGGLLAASLRPQPYRAGLEAELAAGLETEDAETFQKISSIETKSFLDQFDTPHGVWSPKSHVASSLMLEAMDRLASLFPGAQVLDTGTGSGVLIIHAIKHLSAHYGLATDINEKALELTQAYAEKFGVADQLKTRSGSLLDPARPMRFHVSLFTPSSAELAEEYLKHVKDVLEPDGVALLVWHSFDESTLRRAVSAQKGLSFSPILQTAYGKWRVYLAALSPSRLDEVKELFAKFQPPRAGLEAERERVLWQGPFTSLRHQLKTRIHAWQQSGVPNIRVEYSSPIPWEGSEGRSATATNFLLHGGITLRMLNEVVRSIVDDVETSMEISLPSKGTYQIVQVFKPMAGQISGGVDHIAIQLASSGDLEEKPQPPRAGLEEKRSSLHSAESLTPGAQKQAAGLIDWLLEKILSRFNRSEETMKLLLAVNVGGPVSLLQIGDEADHVTIQLELVGGTLQVTVTRQARTQFASLSQALEDGVVNDVLQEAVRKWGGRWDPELVESGKSEKSSYTRTYRWIPPPGATSAGLEEVALEEATGLEESKIKVDVILRVQRALTALTTDHTLRWQVVGLSLATRYPGLEILGRYGRHFSIDPRGVGTKLLAATLAFQKPPIDQVDYYDGDPEEYAEFLSALEGIRVDYGMAILAQEIRIIPRTIPFEAFLQQLLAHWIGLSEADMAEYARSKKISLLAADLELLSSL